jgi:hypothetical protein
MKEIMKLNKVVPSLNDVLICIEENKPKDKKKEENEYKHDDNGELKCIIYTIADKKGAKHIFKITPEGKDSFRIVYTSDGEYPEYVEDDLDSFF